MSKSLLTISNLPSPIEEGDAGVILKNDGSFQVFNTYKNPDPAKMTPRQLEQMETILALVAALKVPEIMNVLKQMAQDPTIFPDVADYGPAH